jgi:hypothetical protein
MIVGPEKAAKATQKAGGSIIAENRFNVPSEN